MYPHPQHVVDFLSEIGLRRDNLGLTLDKFIDWTEDKRGDYSPNKRGYFAQASSLLKQAPSADWTEFVRTLIRRWVSVLERAPFPVRILEAETLWYFTSGRGSSELVGELLSLHQNLALPIIHGSSIRGSAYAYARDFLLPEGQISEEEIKELFGQAPGEEEFSHGALTFFDAFPTEADCLRVTAITNQNDGYYSGNEQLMCRNNVIPIFHLAVSPNEPFLFAIGSPDAQALEAGEGILRQSLRKGGVGRRSRVGYGYFKVFEKGQEEKN